MVELIQRLCSVGHRSDTVCCVGCSMGDASAAERSKVESDVMALLYRSLPDAANARLGSLVPPVLGRRADILAAIAEKEAQLGHLPSTPTTPKIVKP